MKFAIMRHAGWPPAPADAAAQLAPLLDGFRTEDLSFTHGGDRITASADDDSPAGLTQDEWIEQCRLMVLAVVREVCERSDTLECDWYAISPDK